MFGDAPFKEPLKEKPQGKPRFWAPKKHTHLGPKIGNGILACPYAKKSLPQPKKRHPRKDIPTFYYCRFEAVDLAVHSLVKELQAQNIFDLATCNQWKTHVFLFV